MGLKQAFAGRSDTSSASAAYLPRGSIVVVDDVSLIAYHQGVISDAGGDETKYKIMARSEWARARGLRPVPRVFITDYAMSQMNGVEARQWVDLEKPAEPDPTPTSTPELKRNSRLVANDNPLKPIDDDAKNGATYLVFDATMAPPVVAAYWMKHREGVDLIWEGWVFADKLLADLYPAELQPTHYMAMPKPAPERVSVPSEPKHVHPRGQLADMTKAQRDAAEEARLLGVQVRTRVVDYCEGGDLTPLTIGDPSDTPDIRIDEKHARCPIISTNEFLNSETVVLPDGSLMTLQGITC